MRIKGIYCVLNVALLSLIVQATCAQTCCSGGVPVASNLGMPASEAGTLQTSIGYDVNVLETLKSGNTRLDDDSRSRKTKSYLLELGYSISDRFSIDAFLSYVKQERNIFQFNNTNFSSTSGIGDAVLLLKYRAFQSSTSNASLHLGIGTKLPTGASDLTNEQGLTLNADLQPGSGAFDWISWGQYNYELPASPSTVINASVIHSVKGTNTNYLGSQNYRFGNELQVALGISHRIIVNSQILDPSLIFRYRLQKEDRIDNFITPSTGGNWLFLTPGLSYWINPNLSFEGIFSLPIRSDITGTQVTPTYRFRTSLFFKWSVRNNQNILPNTISI